MVEERLSVGPLPSPPPCREREHTSGAVSLRNLLFRLKSAPSFNFKDSSISYRRLRRGSLSRHGGGLGRGLNVKDCHNRLNFYEPTIKLRPMTPTPKANIARARELRRAMTPPERKLWKLLRAHQMEGLHWRRQHPIGNYYADFACSHAALIVELDGRSHDETHYADVSVISRCANWAGRRFASLTTIYCAMRKRSGKRFWFIWIRSFQKRK